MTERKPSLSDLRIDDHARYGGSGRMGLGLLVAVLAVAAGAAAWFWLRAPRALPVRVATVAEAPANPSGAGPVLLNASGYVTARRRATVSSKMTGKVIEVLVEEGMAVKAGQVLARLDDTTPRRYLELAEAELSASRRTAAETEVRLKEARQTLDRARALVRDGISGQAELDRAEAEVDALKARLDLTREQVTVAERQVALRQSDLNDAVIRAPFSGVAISKDAQPGEMVSPVSAGGGFTRTGISTIVDMASLEIEVDVNESFINRVKPGQSIGFEQLDPRILPDMGVKVAFLGAAEPAAGASPPRPRLSIPKAAVRTDQGQSIVFVVVGDRVERRAVRTGDAAGEQVEIVSGLAAGERVVVEGPPDLADGRAVIVR